MLRGVKIALVQPHTHTKKQRMRSSEEWKRTDSPSFSYHYLNRPCAVSTTVCHSVILDCNTSRLVLSQTATSSCPRNVSPSVHTTTQHQSHMPGRFLPSSINQFWATWHSTELLTCSSCLADTKQKAIHNCTLHCTFILYL